jgi:hypothetical protein
VLKNPAKTKLPLFRRRLLSIKRIPDNTHHGTQTALPEPVIGFYSA